MALYNVRVNMTTYVEREVEALSAEEALIIGRDRIWKALSAQDFVEMYERLMPWEEADEVSLLKDDGTTLTREKFAKLTGIKTKYWLPKHRS